MSAEQGHTPLAPERHLPLRQSTETPSRIDTAAGRAIGISWTAHPSDNPYAEAEAFAEFLVRAANTHPQLVEALERLVAEEDRYVRDAGVTLDDLISEAVEHAREVVAAAKGESP